MNVAVQRFGRSYAQAFEAYVREPGEATLRRGYELGREAVTRSLSVMDLATVHHDSLAALAAGEELELRLTRAREFLVESLGAFEMVQRGFHEARDAALVERRHADMLRQLSNFLTDASLAIDASDTLGEVLQLVAEQARELTGADCCVVVFAASAGLPHLEAISCADEGSLSAAFLRRVDPLALHERAQAATRASRLCREELRDAEFSGGIDAVQKAARLPAGWLWAPLATLTGRELGSIHAFDGDGPFTDLDEAVLVHLGQMASAAIERALLYEGRLTRD
jgi:Phosphoserine phosphatase RsbU, N-terminal domain/GAF domain